jgi:hypothetical protein
LFKLSKWYLQFSQDAKSKKVPAKIYVGPMCCTKLIDTTAKENLIKIDADPGNYAEKTGNKFLSEEDHEKVDQDKISALKEELRGSLLSIASKLLAIEHTRLHHLSEAEQQLWNSFEKAYIYKFLTGEKDCIPEFQFNWILPEAPAIRCVLPQGAQPRVQQAAPLPAAQQAPAVPPAQPAAPAEAVLPEAPQQQQQAIDPAPQDQALAQQEVNPAGVPQASKGRRFGSCFKR